jgi:hypothetical protein
MSPSSPRNAPQSTQPSTDVKRRRFLFALGAGSAGAAAAAIPVANAVDATTAQQDESKGYRETEHIRDYYASTRL